MNPANVPLRYLLVISKEKRNYEVGPNSIDLPGSAILKLIGGSTE